jgi:serine/threonine-protein kinase HipA
MVLRGSGRPHYKLVEIQPRHFEALATLLGDTELWSTMTRLAEDVPGAIDRVEAKLPDDFAPSVWTSITTGLKHRRS